MKLDNCCGAEFFVIFGEVILEPDREGMVGVAMAVGFQFKVQCTLAYLWLFPKDPERTPYSLPEGAMCGVSFSESTAWAKFGFSSFRAVLNILLYSTVVYREFNVSIYSCFAFTRVAHTPLSHQKPAAYKTVYKIMQKIIFLLRT